MKKVLLKAYFKNNLGDDLFAKIIVDRYKNDFTIFCKEKLSFFHGYENVKQKNNLLLYIFDKICKKILHQHDIYETYLKRKNDLLVYIGGSLFIENNNLKYWEENAKQYSRNYIPYYILGSNVGPYTDNKFLKILKENIFKNAEDICFRETYSYDLYNDLDNVRYASDIVFSLDKSNIKIKNSNKVVFSIIDAGKKISDDYKDIYEKKIVDLINYFYSKNYKIVLMSFCKSEGDEKAIESIIDKCEDNIRHDIITYFYNGDINQALDVIADSKIVVATRFHAMILGLLFEKTVLPIAYSNKTINVLNDIGFNGKIITCNNIHQFNTDELTEQDINYIHDVSTYVRDAQKHFEKLDKVLEKR